MQPQFASAELNHLLQLELANGPYRDPEDALLAGLKVLRDGREFREQLENRREAIDEGRGIELVDDQALGEFLDAIDAAVDQQRGPQPSPSS